MKPAEAWKLVQQYEPMIRRQAARWPALEREDHLQELRLAVYRAALTFDAEKCKDFSKWAKGYMRASSGRQPLTVVDTTYHLEQQQQHRKKPSHVPRPGHIKSTSQLLSKSPSRTRTEEHDKTYEDILHDTSPAPDERVVIARDVARFRRYALRRVDPGKARDGLAHYLETGGDSLEASAQEVGISRQRLSIIFNRVITEWLERSRP